MQSTHPLTNLMVQHTYSPQPPSLLNLATSQDAVQSSRVTEVMAVVVLSWFGNAEVSTYLDVYAMYTFTACIQKLHYECNIHAMCTVCMKYTRTTGIASIGCTTTNHQHLCRVLIQHVWHVYCVKAVYTDNRYGRKTIGNWTVEPYLGEPKAWW